MIRKDSISGIFKGLAAFAVSLFAVYSCNGGKLSSEEVVNLEGRPLQVVNNMFVVQTENGVLKMRMEGNRMERYDNDSTAYELFPDGFSVFTYNEDNKLESTIFSDQAKHIKYKDSGDEIWKAFGNVQIRNEIKDETMETDTIYWDREKEKIYTDCYVRMFSRDGLMQGYGMVSDQKANNSILLKPFNGYGVVVRDTTEVIIDSVNFIGPFPKK